MRSSDIFKEYVWLIDIIYRSKGISLKELNKHWVRTEMSGGIPMSRLFFNRHRNAIENMFGINIECQRRGGYYYYIEDNDFMRNNSLLHWMIDSLSISNMLMESTSLQDRIMLEHIPAGKEYLQPIINAMKEGHRLQMGYRKFGQQEGYTIMVEPYAIKVFKQRWYLVANDYKRNHPSIYAFDRIVALEETEEDFVYPNDFDTDEFLKDCFGVLYTDDKPQRIVVRAYKPLTSYLRTLPLHHSQKELQSTDGYADFEYYLRPTFDFRQELLSQGEQIEILEPESFRHETAALHERILKRYKRG